MLHAAGCATFFCIFEIMLGVYVAKFAYFCSILFHTKETKKVVVF